ncbi:MAG: zinc dependent phospholipase C family protein [Bacillota bacterium]|nr:zinc dependent phospholipase C family protein [Bacillota bacterium]
MGHMLIASKTCELLEKEYGLAVNRPAFMLGNVLPDTSPRMKRPVHRIENWGDRVNLMIDKLETGVPVSNRRYSLRLGVVCHFVSDFFCLAHNDAYYLKQIAHFIYETRQSKEFIRLKRSDENFDPSLFIPPDMDVIAYLAERHKAFISNEVTYEREFSDSVEICAAICGTLIAEGILLPA